MNAKYEKIEIEFKPFTDEINKNIFSDGATSIQEVVFENGIKYCKERANLYSETKAFWNWYTRLFYHKLHFTLESLKQENFKPDANYLYEWLQGFNDFADMPDWIRGDIFIEHSQNTDEKWRHKLDSKAKPQKQKKVSTIKI